MSHLTAIGNQKGELDGIGSVSLPADETMMANAVSAIRECAPEVNVFEGRVCTGDQFISSDEQKRNITSEFGGLCCEMEGGAIVQICCQNNVPFVIILSTAFFIRCSKHPCNRSCHYNSKHTKYKPNANQKLHNHQKISLAFFRM